jgi:D-xylose transport system substrate-binding protein
MRHATLFAKSLILLVVLSAAGCVSAPPEQPSAGNSSSARTGERKAGPIRIGFSMDTLKEERWQRDKNLFEQRAKELGAEVYTTVANSDDAEQRNQAENLLTKGVDVLVVVPHNGDVAASIVEAAKRQNVPVISYDRLIKNSDVDLYISHQVEKIGEMQAKYLLDRRPTGNYVIVGGSSTDNNALLLHKGQMNILKPAVDRGAIKIVADQYAREWQPSAALNITENALTQTKNDIVAVVASNDGTAGGVVQALEEQKLAGKVLVSGQDADLAALQRIVAGTQAMTIYKPIKPLADAAAEAAIKLARGEKVDATTTINNGKKDVPAILLEPIVVDKSNVVETVVKDGFQKMEDIYKNIPRDQWPATAPSPASTPASSRIERSLDQSPVALAASLRWAVKIIR